MRVIAILLVAALLSHAKPANAADVNVRFGVLHLKGPLVAGDRDRVAKALNENKVRKIALSSGGGDISAAIELATLLRSVAVPVEVRQYCLSACASFLLYGARQIDFDEDVLIGFHAGAALNRMVASRALRDMPSLLDGAPSAALVERFTRETEEGVRENLEKIQEFARMFNIDQRSIAFYVALTLPRSISKVKLWETADGEAKHGLDLAYQCGFWAPSPADMRRLGLAVGKAPENVNPDAVAKRYGFSEPVCTTAYQPEALKGSLEQIVADPAGPAKIKG